METKSSLACIKKLLESFQQNEIEVGKECFSSGRVTRLEVAPQNDEVFILASVKSEGMHKRCQIIGAIKEGSYSYECMCNSKASLCEHFLGALYAAYVQVMGDKNTICKNAADDEIAIDKGLLLWMNEVNALVEGKKSKDEIKPPKKNVQKKIVVYCLERSLRSWEKCPLHVKPMLVRLKKNGDLGGGSHGVLDWNDVLRKKEHPARNALVEEDWNLLFEASRTAEIDDKTILLNGGEFCVQLLKRMVATGRCYYNDIHTEPLKWSKSRKGSFGWKLLNDGSGQRISCEVNPEASVFFMKDGLYVYIDTEKYQIGPVKFSESTEVIQKIADAPVVPLEETEAFAKIVDRSMPKLKKIKPRAVKVRQVTSKPNPVLFLDVKSNFSCWDNDYLRIIAKLSFDYEGVSTEQMRTKTYNLSEWEKVVTDDGQLVKVKRNYNTESNYSGVLQNEGFEPTIYHSNVYKYVTDCDTLQDAAHDFIKHHKLPLEKAGFTIVYSNDFPHHELIEDYDWYVETFNEGDTKNNDWFGVEMGVMIDGERVNILPVLARAYHQNTCNYQSMGVENIELISPDGKKKIYIPSERFDRLLKAFALDFESKSLNENGRLHLSKWAAHQLEELKLVDEKTQLHMMGDEAIYSYGQKLKDISGVPVVEPSKNMASTLRHYQKEGLNWMQFLRDVGLNGILADDMGLGKTIQVLAHIQKEKDAGRLTRPCLVIAPTSLMFNWMSEIEKHTPKLTALVLHGTNRHKLFDQIKNHDIVLTTYPLVTRDKKHLLKHHYHLLILDEAQMIKNSRTQAYQAIQQIDASHRLCLTGTPMENHLGELWSLFNFLMPGFLGNLKVFQKLFRKPIEKEGDTQKQQVLSNRIAPFMLRRTKDVVAKELPEKTVIVREVKFDSKQMDLYEMIRIRAHQKMMQAIAEKGIERSQIAVLEALLKLRQVCCDPRLVKTEEAMEDIPSAKLECLMEMLPQLIEEGRRVLLFSQFTSMLSLIEEELNTLGINYTLLTGSTKDRKTPVEQFQNHEVPLMLLSLKAGGVGLNLTAADTVIHFDPWWNPAVESQATDRAHRIGQKNKVFVYKLVSVGSVEEKILEMQERKKELVNALLESKENKGLALTMEDLEEVFKPLV